MKDEKNIFQYLTPIVSDLLFVHTDSQDCRLGAVVEHFNGKEDLENLRKAQIVLLGCPQDEGVKRNGGRLGSAQAPVEIRRWFYRLVIFGGFERLCFYDLGDLKVQKSLEKTHEAFFSVVSKLLKSNKTVIVLGGGNDISYPDVKALASQSENIFALNIDAHLDVRLNDQRHSGTPYRQLIDEGILSGNNFCEMASQPQVNSPVYYQFLTEQEVPVYLLEDVQSEKVKRLFRKVLDQASKSKSPDLFFGFDMDVVRASQAPGVSAPNVMGLTAKEAIEIAELAGRELKTRIFEITEVNPVYDIDGHTARLAACQIYEFLRARLGAKSI